MKKLVTKNLVTGIHCTFRNDKLFCSICCEGKIHRPPFPTFEAERLKQDVLLLVHSDVCGIIAPSSLGGANYFLTFIDEATKYTWVYFFKTKNEVYK